MAADARLPLDELRRRQAADGAIELPFGRLALDGRLRSPLEAGGGRAVVVGLRPEDIHPAAWAARPSR